MNSRKSLVNEMAEWQAKPKRGRTRPCPNKPWKKAAKVYWRWLIASPFSEREKHIDTSLTRIEAQMGCVFDTKCLAWDYVCPENIYGKRDGWTPLFDNPKIDMAQKNWWKPPDKWNWRWKMTCGVDEDETIYEQTYWLSRVGEPLNPGRLP